MRWRSETTLREDNEVSTITCDLVNRFYDIYWNAYVHELPVFTDDEDRDKSMLYHFHRWLNEEGQDTEKEA